MMNEKRHRYSTPYAPAITTQALVADDRLEPAFDWLCQRRKDWPPHADF